MDQNNGNMLISPSAQQKPGGAGKDWVSVQIDDGIYAWVPPDQKEALAQRVMLSQGHTPADQGTGQVINVGTPGHNGLGLTLPKGIDPQMQKNVSDAAMAGGIAAPLLARLIPGGAEAELATQMLAGLFGTAGGTMYGLKGAKDSQGNDATPQAKAEELISQLKMAGLAEVGGNLLINPAASRVMDSAALGRVRSLFKNTPDAIVDDVRLPARGRMTYNQKADQLAKDAISQQALPSGPWKGTDVEIPATRNLGNLDAQREAILSNPNNRVNIPDFLQNQKQAVSDAALGHGMSGEQLGALREGQRIRQGVLGNPLTNPNVIDTMGRRGLGSGEILPAADPGTVGADRFAEALGNMEDLTQFQGTKPSARLNFPTPEGTNIARQATSQTGRDMLAPLSDPETGTTFGDVSQQYQRAIPVADAMRAVSKRVGQQPTVSFSELMGLASPAIYLGGKAADANNVGGGYGSTAGEGAAALAAILGGRDFLRRPGVSGNLANALTFGAKKLAEPFTSEMVTHGLTLPAMEEANSLTGQRVENETANTYNSQFAGPLGAISNSRLLSQWLAAQQQLKNQSGGS